MSIPEIQEVLKNMSGDELAQTQNAVFLSSGLCEDEKCAALTLIGQELHLRQSESFGRKAGRFWNRHGQKVGLVALGALLGVELGE